MFSQAVQQFLNVPISGTVPMTFVFADPPYAEASELPALLAESMTDDLWPWTHGWSSNMPRKPPCRCRWGACSFCVDIAMAIPSYPSMSVLRLYRYENRLSIQARLIPLPMATPTSLPAASVSLTKWWWPLRRTRRSTHSSIWPNGLIWYS